jgi:enoyl-CoA hydratase
MGLVNRVVPAAKLMEEARTLARTISTKPPVAVRYILEAVASGLDMSFADAQDYEATLFGLVATTEDMREGTRAFLEKRKPTFHGR